MVTMKILKETFRTFKEDHLFWLLFILFIFLWALSTVIFTSFCIVYKLPFKDAIGAYTNLLVFDATIFAPLAAYFFIDNWKEQKNKTFFSMEAKNLWLQLQKTEDYSYILDRLIIDYTIDYYNKLDEFDVFLKQLITTLNSVHYFIELTDDKNIAEANDKYISIQNKYEEFLRIGKFNKEYDENNRMKLIQINQNIRRLLKEYIIIK